MLCDNLGVVHLSHNPVLHAYTKHVELEIHFIMERVASKKVVIQHVSAPFQIADALTKLLGSTSFNDLCVKFKIGLPPS